MGSTFNYAELAYLMVPRPFMVERGHHDGVAPDEWVASEYAKVRWLYDQLGLADRTAIEFFNGGHTIHGQGTFDFLHKHLDWPEPRLTEFHAIISREGAEAERQRIGLLTLIPLHSAVIEKSSRPLRSDHVFS